MFWRFGGYANISTIDSILDKPDVTVEELLDEADLIQELKQQNSKLIEFLRDETILERLLQYIIAPKGSHDEAAIDIPDRETDAGGALGWLGTKRRGRSKSISKDGDDESKEEKQRLKYAYVACEILSSDVWSLSEGLLDNPACLQRFWEYLKQPAPLDSVQAGYFTKVNESLMDKKPDEMIDLFKSIKHVIADMLQHVDCPSIMDLLLKIISLERQEGGQGIVDWLQKQDLIPLLLARLSSDCSISTQTSAGDFIKAIITISANATAQDANVIGPNELTRQLVSQSCVQTLIDEMLKGGNPLTVGVGIVIEVIRKNNSDYDIENAQGPVPKSSDPIYLGTLLRQFALNIPRFMDLIQSPQSISKDGQPTARKELKVAFGTKIEPLGFDRFKTCELMAELLHCSNMALLNERGVEAEVRKRDGERENLKANGKSMPMDDSTIHFSTSVDSQGFTHARAPSIGEAPEEVRRPVLNIGEEEGFENVSTDDVMGGDGKATMMDKQTSLDDDEIADEHHQQDSKEAAAKLGAKSPKSSSHAKLEGTNSDNSPSVEGVSPTATGQSERLGLVNTEVNAALSDISQGLSVAQSLPIRKSSNEAASSATGLQRELSPHPEDTPAPLFSGPKSPTKASISEPSGIAALKHTRNASSIGGSKPQDAAEKATEAPDQDEGSDDPFTTDTNGTPVVGDMLKIMFVKHKVVPTILDFFFRFPWNNFLHNVVYDVVQQVFNGSMERGHNRVLAMDLFETGCITERIIEGQKASDKSQQEQNMRLGYMGHLTLIAEEVVKFTDRHPPELLSQSVLDRVMGQEWIEYVDHTLAETRERDNAILGGVRPDVSVGPRQAVLNAVNAAHHFSGSTALSGLTGNGSMSLDNNDLTAVGGGAAGGYLFSGTSLLSGFNHGSSDEEDEDMGEEGEGRSHQPFSAEEQVGELSFDDVDMDYR